MPDAFTTTQNFGANKERSEDEATHVEATEEATSEPSETQNSQDSSPQG